MPPKKQVIILSEEQYEDVFKQLKIHFTDKKMEIPKNYISKKNPKVLNKLGMIWYIENVLKEKVDNYLEDVPEVGRPSTSSRPSISGRPSTARESVIDPNAPKLPTSESQQITNFIKYYKDKVSNAAQDNDIITLYELIDVNLREDVVKKKLAKTTAQKIKNYIEYHINQIQILDKEATADKAEFARTFASTEDFGTASQSEDFDTRLSRMSVAQGDRRIRRSVYRQSRKSVFSDLVKVSMSSFAKGYIDAINKIVDEIYRGYMIGVDLYDEHKRALEIIIRELDSQEIRTQLNEIEHATILDLLFQANQMNTLKNQVKLIKDDSEKLKQLLDIFKGQRKEWNKKELEFKQQQIPDSSEEAYAQWLKFERDIHRNITFTELGQEFVEKQIKNVELAKSGVAPERLTLFEEDILLNEFEESDESSESTEMVYLMSDSEESEESEITLQENNVLMVNLAEYIADHRAIILTIEDIDKMKGDKDLELLQNALIYLEGAYLKLKDTSEFLTQLADSADKQTLLNIVKYLYNIIPEIKDSIETDVEIIKILESKPNPDIPSKIFVNVSNTDVLDEISSNKSIVIDKRMNSSTVKVEDDLDDSRLKDLDESDEKFFSPPSSPMKILPDSPESTPATPSNPQVSPISVLPQQTVNTPINTSVLPQFITSPASPATPQMKQNSQKLPGKRMQKIAQGNGVFRVSMYYPNPLVKSRTIRYFDLIL